MLRSAASHAGLALLMALTACSTRSSTSAGTALVPALQELHRRLSQADSISSDTLGEMARLGQRIQEVSKSLKPGHGMDEGAFTVARVFVMAEGQLLSLLAKEPASPSLPGTSLELLREGLLALGVSEAALAARGPLDRALLEKLASEQAQEAPVQLSGEAQERILAMAGKPLPQRLERVAREALLVASRCDDAFADPVNPLSLILRNESVAFGSASMAIADLPTDDLLPVVRARAEIGSRFLRDLLLAAAASDSALSATRLISQRIKTSEAIVARVVAILEDRGNRPWYPAITSITSVALLVGAWWYWRRRSSSAVRER